MKFFSFIQKLWTKKPRKIRPVFIFSSCIQDSMDVIERMELPKGGLYSLKNLFPPSNGSHFAKETNLYVFNEHLKRQRKHNEPMYILGSYGEYYHSKDSWFLFEIDCDIYTVNSDNKICAVWKVDGNFQLIETYRHLESPLLNTGG